LHIGICLPMKAIHRIVRKSGLETSLDR